MSAITPFRARATMPGNCAPWLRAGTGERWQFAEGAMIDARLEKVTQGTSAHIPLIRYPYDRTRVLSVPPTDALAELGNDRQILRGLSETDAAYGERLRRAFPTWRLAGTARAVLSQMLSYLSTDASARAVWTRYGADPARLPGLLAHAIGAPIVGATTAAPIVITTGQPHGFANDANVTVTGVTGLSGANGAWTITALTPTTFSLNTSNGSGTYTVGTGRAALTSAIPSASYPPTRASSTWDTYVAGRSLDAEPARTYVLSGGAGDWDWDSTSPVTGSYGWWGTWIVLYNTDAAGNIWTQQAPLWGTGTTYTPSADGYYSTVSGGAYAASGSYTGTATLWGAGSTYAPSADGYYSSISFAGRYQASGSYTGAAQAWGLSVSSLVGQGLVTIARQFRCAAAWVRGIIVAFSTTLFDPAQSADDVHNPDGSWGYWSKVSGGAYAPSRLATATYSDDPLHELG